MTLQERLEGLLVKHGLWPEEAKAVLQMCVEAPENECMAVRWDDEATGYPPQLLAILWMSVKQHAVTWIDANKPKHVARNALIETPAG